MQDEAYLTTTALVRWLVCDLLHQSQCPISHLPEVVDLAVVGTGLGLLQSQINLVSTGGAFWDTTRWDVFPLAFLDHQQMAYAFAIAAWVRDESSPVWAAKLPSNIKRAMLKSLKFLNKTQDSFFDGSPESKLGSTNQEWLKRGATKSESQQLIAVRQLQLSEEPSERDQQTKFLLDKMGTSNADVLMHSIAAAERLKLTDDSVVEELHLLLESPESKVRAKAMCALTETGKVNEGTVYTAGKFLEANKNFEVFAGLYGLSSQKTVPNDILPLVDRGFIRALQFCNYEFVGLYIQCYTRWLPDPKSHLESILTEDKSEFLEVAIEALEKHRQETIELKRA